MSIRLKMWPQVHTECFCKISPSDLDPKWPMFKPIKDFIEAHILTMFPQFGLKIWPLECTQDFFFRFKPETLLSIRHDRNSQIHKKNSMFKRT